MISIICPTYNEEKYISKCLESINNQDYHDESIEILIIDAMSDDNTRKIIETYMKKLKNIKIFENHNKAVPFAMNIGIKNSKGDIIIRIDAHAYYPENYISTLVKYLKELNADNVGSICKTEVLNKTKKAIAIKEILQSKLGVGNSQFRLGTNKIIAVDTVPFGCWRKEIFKKYGLFNEKLIRNQDIELNKRILRNGGKIFLIPDTYCIYYARENIKDLIRNNYQNGKWNILTAYFTKDVTSLSLRHYIPMIFILSLILPLILTPIQKNIIYIPNIILLLYFLIVFSESISISIKKRVNLMYLILGFISLHFSYGIGSISSIYNIIKSEKEKRKKIGNS
jgi:glycosyltransferase involved in cell wall biosynthesis